MVGETLNAIPAVWDTILKTRGAIINRNGYLYACFYETRFNLSLLDSLNTSLKDVKLDSDSFNELMKSFETSATITLLAGSDRRSYRRLIKSLSKNWKNSISFENEDDSTVDPVENTIEAMNFAVLKIETLRSIIKIYKEGETTLRTINLDTRFKNIRKALVEVQKALKKVIHANEKCMRWCIF
jgi:hypothetical protein